MAASSKIAQDVADELTEIISGYVADQKIVMASSARGMVHEMSRLDPARADQLFQLMSRRPELRAPIVHTFIDRLVAYQGGRVYMKDATPRREPSRVVTMTATDAELGIRPARGRLPLARRR